MDMSYILSRSLGLSDKEAAIYVALLESGLSTVKPIAEKAGVKRTSVYNFIDRLVELGVVSKTVIRRRKHYQAVPPEKLVALAESQVRELERQLPELNRLRDKAQSRIRVNYYEGPDEVKNIVREETRCKKEARYIWPGKETLEMIGGPEFMTRIDRERMKRGVEIRAIRFRQKDQPFSTSAHGPEYLRTIRYAPPFFNVSIAMGIYDTGKVGFFSSRKEGFGVLIESVELVALMGAFYELLWNNCAPAREGQG